MAKKKNDERAITVKMLDRLRGLGKPINIFENEERSDSIPLTGSELNSEQAKFRETVSSMVEFNSFNIYPSDSNAFFSGKLRDLNNMEWSFSLDETDGIYIDVNSLQLTDNALGVLQKLKGYYKNWKEEWANKLATEYKSNQSGDIESEIPNGE